METVRFPAGVIVPVRVAVALTLIWNVLKFEAPICGDAPVKFAVPVAVKVPPDFVQVEAPVPVTVIVTALSLKVPADKRKEPIEMLVLAVNVVVPDVL